MTIFQGWATKLGSSISTQILMYLYLLKKFEDVFVFEFWDTYIYIYFKLIQAPIECLLSVARKLFSS